MDVSDGSIAYRVLYDSTVTVWCEFGRPCDGGCLVKNFCNQIHNTLARRTGTHTHTRARSLHWERRRSLVHWSVNWFIGPYIGPFIGPLVLSLVHTLLSHRLKKTTTRHRIKSLSPPTSCGLKPPTCVSQAKQAPLQYRRANKCVTSKCEKGG